MSRVKITGSDYDKPATKENTQINYQLLNISNVSNE